MIKGPASVRDILCPDIASSLRSKHKRTLHKAIATVEPVPMAAAPWRLVVLVLPCAMQLQPLS